MATVRAAVIEDAETIADLLQQLGYERRAADIAQHLVALDKDAAILVAVDEDGRLVGCLHVLVDNRLAEGRRGEITSLVVAADVRSRGIGADMVAASQKWLQERGIGSLRVRCNAVRDRAHRFYARLGFQLTKSQKVFDITVDAPLRGSALVSKEGLP
jgi:N-acetylglutamate synthase-like GNAT family acetyltransferase